MNQPYPAPRPDGTRTAALITLSDPSVTDTGKNMVLRGFTEHLVDRLGPGNLHLVHVGRPLRDPDSLPGVHVHELGSRLPRELPMNLASGLLTGRSLQETFTRSRRRSLDLTALLRSLEVDVEIVDTIRMAQYLDGYQSRGQRVLYLDDLYSVRYRRMLVQLRQGAADIDPLGEFRTHLPGFLHPLARVQAVRTGLLRFEASRMANVERKRTVEYGGALLLNEREAEQLQADTGQDVVAIPPMIPPRPVVHHWNGLPEFCFVGMLSVPHNHDGLCWFLDEIFDRVLQQRPDARLHVIGRHARAELRSKAGAFGDRVVMHGFVPDLDAAMGRMAALVNPLRFGSGIKIKSLEALARGVPVVGTPVAAEGVIGSNRPAFQIRETPAEIADALVSLTRPEAQQVAAEDALALYTERFSPEAAGRIYDDAFRLGLSPSAHVGAG